MNSTNSAAGKPLIPETGMDVKPPVYPIASRADRPSEGSACPPQTSGLDTDTRYLTDHRIATVLATIEATPAIDISDLASSVRLSQSRLRHLFHAAARKSLHQHLLERRLSLAAHLLATSYLSVKEVAAATGYRDVNHFIRMFRRRYFASPGAFRRAAAFDSK